MVLLRTVVLPFLIFNAVASSHGQSQKPTPPVQSQKQAPPKPTVKESLWTRIARIAGLTATPSTQKGPDDELVHGDIWVADLAQNTRLQLTHDGGYRSPIFLTGDREILALRGEDVVLISVAGGEPRKVSDVKGATKLVGVSLDEPNKVLILTEDENQRIALKLLSLKDAQITGVPFDEESKEDRRMIVHIRNWERVYGDIRVYVKNETKNGLAGPLEWTDVYLSQGDGVLINISKCDGVNCGQPSLAQSKKVVVYIKAAAIFNHSPRRMSRLKRWALSTSTKS